MLTRYRLWTAGVQLSFAGRVEAEDEVSLGIPDSRQANRRQWQAGRSGAARTSSGDARIPKYVEGIAASTDGPRANWPRRAVRKIALNLTKTRASNLKTGDIAVRIGVDQNQARLRPLRSQATDALLTRPSRASGWRGCAFIWSISPRARPTNSASRLR